MTVPASLARHDLHQIATVCDALTELRPLSLSRLRATFPQGPAILLFHQAELLQKCVEVHPRLHASPQTRIITRVLAPALSSAAPGEKDQRPVG
jgi:hypothetical protein